MRGVNHVICVRVLGVESIIVGLVAVALIATVLLRVLLLIPFRDDIALQKNDSLVLPGNLTRALEARVLALSLRRQNAGDRLMLCLVELLR